MGEGKAFLLERGEALSLEHLQPPRRSREGEVPGWWPAVASAWNGVPETARILVIASHQPPRTPRGRSARW